MKHPSPCRQDDKPAEMLPRASGRGFRRFLRAIGAFAFGSLFSCSLIGQECRLPHFIRMGWN
jgi:hypothetical protein